MKSADTKRRYHLVRVQARATRGERAALGLGLFDYAGGGFWGCVRCPGGKICCDPLIPDPKCCGENMAVFFDCDLTYFLDEDGAVLDAFCLPGKEGGSRDLPPLTFVDLTEGESERYRADLRAQQKMHERTTGAASRPGD